MEISELTDRVQAWCEKHQRSILFDPHDEKFCDVASGQFLSLPLKTIERYEEKQNPETGSTYMVLLREDGVQIVLGEPGIAWAPINVTGVPIDDFPEVVCWRDFQGVCHVVEHQLRDHPEEPPGRESIMAVMFATAILAGARVVGFDVGRAEHHLNRLIGEIEHRVGDLATDDDD
ncbi:MAG: hypothetical protein CMH54_11020 [Myxococcales bacterium]|nr:hypothetical protein [Myxococcales bacterium]